MSPSEPTALWLVLAPSPALAAALLLVHAGAAAAATASAIPGALKVLIWLVIAGHATYRVMADGLRRTPGSPVALAWDAHGGWRVVTRNRAVLPARLRRHVFVSPWFTVLPLRVDGGATRTVLIVADCVDADRFRQLRVRWGQERARADDA